jgi:hypothetical protein
MWGVGTQGVKDSQISEFLCRSEPGRSDRPGFAVVDFCAGRQCTCGTGNRWPCRCVARSGGCWGMWRTACGW